MDIGRVDAANDLRDRERRDVPDLVRLRHAPGNVTLNRAALVKARRIDTDVISGLVPGGVFELHVRKLRGHVDCRVHVPKRGREDQIGPLKRHLRHCTFRISPFRHTLLVHGLDLVAEVFLDSQTAFVVLVSPAPVTDRPDVDEPDLQRLMPIGKRAGGQGQRRSTRGQECTFLHE